MENFPRTITEFEEWFSTEESCRKYLWELRWPNGFVCPQCSHDKTWTTSRGLYVCAKCGLQISVTSGTLFQGTRKPLHSWFRAIWYITNQKHGVSALGLQRVLDIKSYTTAWRWLHKLRIAMVRPGREMLSGVVEVDETYLGGHRPGKRGRGAEHKMLIGVAVEIKNDGHIGRIRMKHVPDASADSLVSFIQDSVEKGSTIATDGWLGYHPVAAKGYCHEIAKGLEDVGVNMTPHVHRIASLLKRWLIGTHQGAPEASHIAYYLDEFTFRFNRRTSDSRGKLFYRLMQQAAQVGTVKNQDLVGKKR